jgi:metal-responsive CopG/Arc/MetJ family transcriptional regulator
MKAMTRVTIRVPSELLEAIDRKLARDEEPRSAVIRRVLEAAVRDAEARQDDERYIQAYREQPQTEEEFGWADQVACEQLAELPWA